MPISCNVADDCTGDAVIQSLRDCHDCPDIAAAHRVAEVTSTELYTAAMEHHKAAVEARDEAAAIRDNIAFAAAISQIDAAVAVIAEHGQKAVRAAIRAAEHEAPHTHPVYACAKHAKAAK